MDNNKMDEKFQAIAIIRNELHGMSYDHARYDELEDKLHELEDDFQQQYGAYLQPIFQTIHDHHCSDTEVLHPVAYMARSYHVKDNQEFTADALEGIYVEVEKHPHKDTRLVMVPNPTRIILTIPGVKQKTVWSGATAE